MRVSRRTWLKLAAGGAAAAWGRRAAARGPVTAGPDAVGMLHDSTLCVGCGACVAACEEANGLVPGGGGATGSAPADVLERRRSALQVVRIGGAQVSVKRQCMHCVDPSCVSVCMLGALHKEGEGKRDLGGERRGTGIVLYDKDLCVGCRYCQIACAFTAPRFEWRRALPVISKCELCRRRAGGRGGGALAVADPACCQVCPTGAVVYGRRADLLDECRRRMAAEPRRYAPRIYGERDGGGTQVLYLAAAGVGFGQLGFPELPDQSSAQFSESVSHAPYLHGLTPFALYAAAAFVIHRNRRRDDGGGGGAQR